MRNHVCVVAEISANHNQNYSEAEELVYIAKEVGADAVKLQTYTPDTMTIKSNRPEFIISGGTPWDNKTLYDLYSEAYMPWEWQPKLKKVADEIGIELFSTPFDKTAVDFLESIGVPRYKIASYELIDLPLIEYVASKKKPMIISTGMATFDEIKDAVVKARKCESQITLLKCVSSYPAQPEEMHLMSMVRIGDYFDFKVGLSDHTLGITAPIVATALGASMIEKHITLSRGKSVDSSFSLEPYEFKLMVDNVRETEKMLGNEIGLTEHEQSSLVFRRSLFVVENIKKGDLFTEDNVRSIRPGNGLQPKYINNVLGKIASIDIEKGTPFEWGLIER